MVGKPFIPIGRHENVYKAFLSSLLRLFSPIVRGSRTLVLFFVPMTTFFEKNDDDGAENGDDGPKTVTDDGFPDVEWDETVSDVFR